MKRIITLCVVLSLLLITNVFAQEEAELSPMAKKAKDLCLKGEAYFMEHGLEKAYAAFTDPEGEFIDGNLYLFVYNFLGEMQCHGIDPELVGKNLLDLQDPNGVYFIQEFIKTANSESGQGWVEYMWKKPPTMEIMPKVGYVKKLGDDLLVVCGFYKE